MVPAVFPFISNVFSTVSSVRETLALEVPWGKGLERRRLKWHYFVTAVGIQTLFFRIVNLFCCISFLLVFLVYSFVFACSLKWHYFVTAVGIQTLFFRNILYLISACIYTFIYICVCSSIHMYLYVSFTFYNMAKVYICVMLSTYFVKVVWLQPCDCSHFSPAPLNQRRGTRQVFLSQGLEFAIQRIYSSRHQDL